MASASVPASNPYPTGNVSFLQSGGTSIYPATRERKWKCQCGAALAQERLATRVKKVGKHYRIEAEKLGLVCPTCGPVAWEV